MYFIISHNQIRLHTLLIGDYMQKTSGSKTTPNSRTHYALKNMFSGFFITFLTLLFPFITRTVFIRTLGAEFLGINGLFTNLLGVLSFAELGVGTAITFSLYKPLAENDRKTIQSIMRYYKKVYRVIAAFVLLSGLVLLPFLSFFTDKDNHIGSLRFYFILYLLNSALSYLLIYKQTLLIADQQNYTITNYSAAALFIKTLLCCGVLLWFHSFTLYLLADFLTGIIKNIFINRKIKRTYPFLNDPAPDLPAEQLIPIKKNIKALILHKLGGISVYQTDNIIISGFIGLVSVGLLSNYLLIINSINQFTGMLFNSACAGFGNVLATEKSERQYFLFKAYQFLGFWVYGWTAICLYALLQPFMAVWLGKNMLLSLLTVFLIVLNYYLTGMRAIVETIKGTAGLYHNDKYVSIAQGGINFVLSLLLVKPLGIAGVYLGTIISGFLPLLLRPHIVYRNVFSVKTRYYLYDFCKYTAVVLLAGSATCILCQLCGNFLLGMALCLLVPNLILFVVFRNTNEFQYLKAALFQLLKEKRRNE